MGKLRRLYAWFTDVKVFERGKTRSQLVATQLITRFLLYQDSHEFVNALDLQDDFHIHNSVANMHLWLLFQRLRDFSHNKFAHQLKEELIENFNRIVKHEMDTVEVLKRYKKVEQIDNYLQAIRNNLDFHFHINGVSVQQPEFKLDALVWTCIFHEKVPRYSDVVYRMACYLLEHHRYL